MIIGETVLKTVARPCPILLELAKEVLTRYTVSVRDQRAPKKYGKK